MTVNHEIKSHLAKLLATEDLVVEHRYVETAQFNVHTRVLTLPMWEKASSVVYDMLVGHEVGHALYTPDRDWLKERTISPQLVNIVEDVRIEKMMKRRYAGISKTFYRGYSELSDQDFFALENEDIDLMNLADRINLYFKIGNFVNIPFNDEEKYFVKMVSDCETFDDALDAAEELYKYCKSEVKTDTHEKQEQGESEQGQESPDGSIEPGESMDDESMESTESENDESSSGTVEQNQQKEMGGIGNDLELKTVDSLEESIKELASMDGFENVYTELPKINLDNIIVPNFEIHERCRKEWESYEERGCFAEVDSKYNEFKKSTQKEVNYLVKEFECRKAADSYARATTSRTGVLDCSKLHTYKYNEDLFKKVATLSDGKNHGLIFMLDWSGSMCDVMLDTIKQMFNLVWFCKKVGIPFEVYAFTNDYPLVKYDEDGPTFRPSPYEKKDGLIAFTEWFSLMNLLTSKTNTKELENQMRNIIRIAYLFSRSYYHLAKYPLPTGLCLSGTPLNEAIVCLHTIIPQFKKQHNLQKVQCVVLSDGEASPLVYHRELQRFFDKPSNEPYIGTGRLNSNSFLRDRKTGNTYSFDCEWHGFTDVLLHNLRDNFTDVNFIGIRVLEPREAKSFIRRYCGWGTGFYEIETVWRKQRAFSIKNSGYHTYFGISSNALSQDTEFSVKEDATKTQIKSAFVKSLKSKKMNKKILNEFVELVV